MRSSMVWSPRVGVPYAAALLVLQVAGTSVAATRRVAVLPFEGPSASDVQAVVGAALAADRTVVPADQVARAVRVVGRNDTSPEAFAAIARRLGVGAVLDGRVIKDDRWRLRLSVRSATTGSLAGTVMWSGPRLRDLVANVQRGAPTWLHSMLDGDVEPTAPRPAPVTAAPAPEPEVPATSDDDPPRSTEVAARVTARRGEPSQPTWEISIGPRVVSRTFTYTDNLSQLPGYTLAAAPALVAEAELFPSATSSSIARNFGFAGHFESSFGVKTEGRDGAASHSTTARAYWGGARYRLPINSFLLSGGVDYGEHRFEMDVNDAVAPNVRYAFLRPSLAGRAEAGGGLSLCLTAAYLHILSVGGMDDPARFPRITATGAEIVGAIAYAVDNDFELRLTADLRHYAHTMHVRPGDPMIAGGALDEHFGAALLLTYRHR
jgi:TolB-like protein